MLLKKVNPLQKLFAALLSGLLLFAAWPVSLFTFLIFFAFVPLFWLVENTNTKANYFWHILLAMLIWNASTTWWIWNSTEAGAAGAIITNSLLMCVPWMLYRAVYKTNNTLAFTAFVCFWLSWEYLHHNWDLSWPWLTLGNVFAQKTNWIQWYEFTGTTGGSIWVLVVNILVYKLIKSFLNADSKKWQILHFLNLAGVLFVPILVSFLVIKIGKLPTKQYNGSNIVVVQPNVNPYTEKFNTDPQILVNELINLSESKIDSNTQLVVWPETAVPTQVFENQFDENTIFQNIFTFVKRHPQLMLVTGIDSYKFYGEKNPKRFSVRKSQQGFYYEAFNTAMAYGPDTTIKLYHKTMLVPGVETLPTWLGFMSKIFDDFGGISGTLGRSDSAIVFKENKIIYKPAPLICYESIYSDYTTDYIRQGANVITIITNDAWWGNTPGYKQLAAYAQLRAIETRCYIARSANTGISSFIDNYGKTLNPQPWQTKTAIKMNVPVNNRKTFYVRHGDYLSRIAWPLTIIFLAWLLFMVLPPRRKKKK